MWAKIKMIMELLKMLSLFIKYVEGEINHFQLNAELKKLKEQAKRASEGSLLDRLRGGRELEDNFNDRIDGDSP